MEYAVSGSEIRCTVKNGKPVNVSIYVNHAFVPATVEGCDGAKYLLSYEYGPRQATCYQEWIAEVDGGYKRLHSFGARIPARWRDIIE